MRQYTSREFIKIVEFNGFYYNRHNGDHAIYVNDKGRHISIPRNLECVIALRLVKENNLITNIKRRKKMTESGYYPPGAEYDSNAPWNQVDNPEREIKVTVSVTLSKTVKIKVSDYEITNSGKDEDGNYYEDIDYSQCDFKEAVEKQITMPQDAYYEFNKVLYLVDDEGTKDKLRDLKDWRVENLEVESEV